MGSPGLVKKHLSFPGTGYAVTLRAQEGDFRNWTEIRPGQPAVYAVMSRRWKLAAAAVRAITT